MSFCGYILLFENGMQIILEYIFSLMTSSNKDSWSDHSGALTSVFRTLLIFRKNKYSQKIIASFVSKTLAFWKLISSIDSYELYLNYVTIYISIVRNIFYIIINDEHFYVLMIKKIFHFPQINWNDQSERKMWKKILKAEIC